MVRNEKAGEFILDAAAHLVQEGDVDALTFADIATMAEIEDADVRAVFPTMEALVKALMERMFSAFIAKVEGQIGDDEEPGAWTRAYVRASSPEVDEERFSDIAAVLLKSVTYKPDLIETVRVRQAEIHAAILADGIDPVTAAIVRLAVDGLWLNQMFEIEALPDGLEDAVFERLIDLAAVPAQS